MNVIQSPSVIRPTGARREIYGRDDFVLSQQPQQFPAEERGRTLVNVEGRISLEYRRL